MKNKVRICLIILMIFLCGCKENKEIQTHMSNTSWDNLDDEQRQHMREEDFILVDTYHMTQDGVFFIGGSSASFLSYYDFSAEETFRLCDKPNCMHNEESCNAYISGRDNIIVKDGIGIDSYATDNRNLALAVIYWCISCGRLFFMEGA